MSTAVFTWTVTAAATYTWTDPAGTAAADVQLWAGGGGGGGKGNSGSYGGSGGGGGEFAEEPALAVTGGTTYNVVVGARGSGGSRTGNGGNGSNSTFNSTSVVAHGGGGGKHASTTPGTGGTGSTNTNHFNGGSGAGGLSGYYGGGGGGSGGTASPGGSASGATGASAVTGGGPGGNSANFQSGYAPSSGPGGGGGGAGYGTGGTGYAGQAIIWCAVSSPFTYSTDTAFQGATATWTCPAGVTAVSWVITGTAAFNGNSSSGSSAVTPGTAYTFSITLSGSVTISWVSPGGSAFPYAGGQVSQSARRKRSQQALGATPVVQGTGGFALGALAFSGTGLEIPPQVKPYIGGQAYRRKRLKRSQQALPTPPPAGVFGLAGLGFSGTVSVSPAATGGFALGALAFSGTDKETEPAAGGFALGALAFSGSAAAHFPFPRFALGLMYEVLINGTWTDITDFVYQRDVTTITRGLPDETQGVTPSQMTLTLNNRDGRFSPKNTLGAFYPYLSRNVQLRVSVTEATASVTGVAYSGYRFWGEVSNWPPRWDSTGNDVYCQVVVSGVLRRYIQGAALGSPMDRYYSNLSGNFAPVAVWPCEDGSKSVQFANLIPDGNAMTFTGSPNLASDASLGGSDPLPVINSSTWHGETGADADPLGTGSLTRTTPGTFTWTAPPGVTSVDVTELVGGGGGGGDTGGYIGGGGGGGGEAVINGSVAVTGGTTYTYVVPSGGAAGSASNGSTGGNATWAGDSHTAIAHGGSGGTLSGSGGAGGTGSTDPTHHHGGAGASGEESSSSYYGSSLNGFGGSTGTGDGGTASQQSTSWTSPITGTVSVGAQAGGGGGSGGGSNHVFGGGGGGGGGYSNGTIDVTEGSSYTFFAGNGGNGGDVEAHGNPGDSGAASSVDGDSGSVAADGGGGGQVATGPGGSGGSGSTASGSNGEAGDDGDGFGGDGGDAGNGGYGESGGSEGEPGSSSGGSGAGGGGGGGGASGGGGGNGYIDWNWIVEGAPAGGGGGSSAGTGSNGHNGSGSVGGYAPAGGGAGGNQSAPGNSPGGGGGGGYPAFGSNPAGAPGNGAPGKVAFSWSGGMTSPVPADIVRFFLHVDPDGETDGIVLLRFLTYGTVDHCDLVYHTGGNLELIGYNASDSVLFDSGSKSFGADGTPLFVDMELTGSGSNIAWSLSAIEPGSGSVVGTYTGTLTTASVGNVSDVYINPDGSTTASATAAGWIIVQTYADTLVNVSPNLSGYDGERVADRISRLCAEQGIGFELNGLDTDTPQMGPQQDDTLVSILQSCMDLDKGMLYETRDQFGLGYRTRVSMQNQSPVIILDYSAGTLADQLQPTEDDQQTRNDITVTRTGGSSVHVQDTTSAMSILSPPEGVGDYTFSATVQAYADTQLASYAAWLLMLGTVDDYRYPQIALNMARTEVANLFATIAGLDEGDYVQLFRLPQYLTLTTVDQLCWGFTETLNAFTWTIAINAVPETPYKGSGLPTW